MYQKENSPSIKYMPVWTLDELLVVAENETMDLDMVKDGFYLFGGNLRYTLQTDQDMLDRLRTELNTRCMALSTNLQEALCTIIDDDSNPVYDTCRFSGFVLCYTHSFKDGELFFRNFSYKMTSEYVDKLVSQSLGLNSAQDCVNKLTEQLRGGW
jgi:hypothetical protein